MSKKNNKLYKGTLQNIILKLLAQEVKMYGYQMTQRAKDLTKGELDDRRCTLSAVT
jgi:DNA-binding PadR family transcriptional regulator